MDIPQPDSQHQSGSKAREAALSLLKSKDLGNLNIRYTTLIIYSKANTLLAPLKSQAVRPYFELKFYYKLKFCDSTLNDISFTSPRFTLNLSSHLELKSRQDLSFEFQISSYKKRII
jgi:hypothetical protein